MDTSYIMIDGSYLCASINYLQKIQTELKNKKVYITQLTNDLVDIWLENVDQVTGADYYFKKGDYRINKFLNYIFWGII